MKIVFLGTPDFAVASLDILVKNGYNIAAVVTAPDKPAGRGQKLQQSAVKEYAIAYNLKILQPEKLKAPEFIEELKQINADLQIVVAFRMLPEMVWNMPHLGTFNLHGSLLPQYRGAAPINWAVINGETQTGVTTFFLKHEIDTGKIIFSASTPIAENETTGEIHDRLMDIGAQLVLKTVKAIELGNYPQIEQEDVLPANLKHAPKIFKNDCRIDWNKNLDEIHNFIRGLSPFPTAFTTICLSSLKEAGLKIFKSKKEKAENDYPTGTVLTDDKTYIKIAVKGGYIHILELQLEGKSRTTIDAFIRGNKIQSIVQSL
jgi:methionyl-tRNA formyltransferase